MLAISVAWFPATHSQQFNGREGETATLLFDLSVFPQVAWRRFRPTSSQPFAVSWLIIAVAFRANDFAFVVHTFTRADA